MTKSKDIKNSSYAGIELNELLNNHNNDRDRQAILTRNFNEINTPPARIEGAASGEEVPHKLYNNFWDFGTGVIEFKDADNCKKMVELLSENSAGIGEVEQKEYDPKLYNKKSKFEGMGWEVGERRGGYPLNKEKVSQSSPNAEIKAL